MCKYCDGAKTMLNKEVLDDWILGWEGGTIIKGTSTYTDLHLFIDRGYLRLVDTDDSQCLDHGDKICIKFCPMCGSKLHNNS